MPAALVLDERSLDKIDEFTRALEAMGHTASRSTVQAARTFRGRVDRAGGWDHVDTNQQLIWKRQARPFVSWLLVTGQLTATADFLAMADLRLGLTARKHRPEIHRWFTEAAVRVDATSEDTALQWNALCKIAALTGVRPDEIGTDTFAAARTEIYEAYTRRGQPEAGRNVRSILHRLHLTLFHAGKINSLARAAVRPPVSVTGWEPIAPSYREAALRYVNQVQLSLRPATVKHIEQHLRVFGTWLAEHHREVSSCAELERSHIESFKTWLAVHPSDRTGEPLARTSVKEQLINLSCFFDRITDWGYPDAPTRPLIFVGDFPKIDRPLPRFLDDAAAAKLARATRAEPDPLARLCVEMSIPPWTGHLI